MPRYTGRKVKTERTARLFILFFSFLSLVFLFHCLFLQRRGSSDRGDVQIMTIDDSHHQQKDVQVMQLDDYSKKTETFRREGSAEILELDTDSAEPRADSAFQVKQSETNIF